MWALLLAHLCAKSVTTPSKSILRARLFSMERMASPLSLSCDIVLRKYVLINFSLENDLSAVATVTGMVKNNLTAVATSRQTG